MRLRQWSALAPDLTPGHFASQPSQTCPCWKTDQRENIEAKKRNGSAKRWAQFLRMSNSSRWTSTVMISVRYWRPEDTP